ncbi:hypothetical protein J2045_004340 [Peteryoungia aggregata LMG 23059]|uniref:Uncharacterized protein n=1 Tax=Peteryoungia aggregata LMG 23059 TaxID=1368425 RepID=A0ABU0GD59_9HYPH|nr:hypothetical protein [Peteryoungia aggregata LMG 23059]
MQMELTVQILGELLYDQVIQFSRAPARQHSKGAQ